MTATAPRLVSPLVRPIRNPSSRGRVLAVVITGTGLLIATLGPPGAAATSRSPAIQPAAINAAAEHMAATTGRDTDTSARGSTIVVRISSGGSARLGTKRKKSTRQPRRRVQRPRRPALSEAKTLTIDPPAATIQPGRTALVNMPTNVFIDPSPTSLTTVALGDRVTFRLAPASYLWTLGDGQRLGPTADPGGAYPRMTTTHTYTEPGTFDVRVHTVFRAEVTLPDRGTVPVSGTATTTAPVGRIEVLRAPVQRVADPLG